MQPKYVVHNFSTEDYTESLDLSDELQKFINNRFAEGLKLISVQSAIVNKESKFVLFFESFDKLDSQPAMSGFTSG